MSTLPGDSTIAGAPTAPHAGRTASTRYHRPRRAFGDAVLHAPQTLRALVRTDEIWLVVLSAFVGCGAGIAVWLMTETTQLIHQVLFRIGAGERLSAMVELDPIRTVAVPTLGGLLIGLIGLAVVRYHPRRAVDPIEANALYGGRMSLNDSLIVVVQTILSNGVGASVGLEAGYTQIGSAMASRFGRMFRVRRNDLRLLVGCGAAAAIAGAFNAPLTGAFYAFELVIGTYSLGTFAPVAVAAIVVGRRGQRSRRRTVRSRPPGADARRGAGLHPDPRPRHGVRPGRHRHHARRDADRGAVPQEPRPGLAPPDVRRTRRRCVSA